MKKKEKDDIIEEELVVIEPEHNNDVKEEPAKENLTKEAEKGKETPSKEQKEKQTKTIQIKYDPNLFTIVLSVCAIILTIFGRLLMLEQLVVAFKVFYWLAGFSIMGALGIHVFDFIKSKKFTFQLSTALLALATITWSLVSLFLFI